MKKIIAYIFLLITLTSSCTQKTNYGEPVEEPAIILKSMMNFLVYRQDHLRLCEDFIALNTTSNIINKDSFLNLLSSGEYLPLRLVSKDSSSYYRLYKLSDTASQAIRQTIRYWAIDLYKQYKMEGKELPVFNFVDMEENVYNKETTKNKILVLKCWFINCIPCVQEIPAVNKIVEQYKDRDDILFISLALDSKDDLKKFLKHTTFNYHTIPNQKIYLNDSLRIGAYPTHLIINKQGLIANVVNDANEMAVAIKKEASK